MTLQRTIKLIRIGSADQEINSIFDYYITRRDQKGIVLTSKTARDLGVTREKLYRILDTVENKYHQYIQINLIDLGSVKGEGLRMEVVPQTLSA
jgi:DNA-binding phage protein